MSKQLLEIPKEYTEEYAKKFITPAKLDTRVCARDITKFSHQMLGIRMRDYQSLMLDPLTSGNERSFIWCLPRQVGKSVAICILAIWAAYFNKCPDKVTKGTAIYIISRSDDQAKELLIRIRTMIDQADRHMATLLKNNKGFVQKWFTQYITEPNNSQQITFKNGSYIKSVPPTDAIRGKSAGFLVIDEAAFLKHDSPDKWFNESASPTTSATDGYTIISSTPNGQRGFFFRIMNPFDQFVDLNYNKFWAHHSINTDFKYQEYVKDQKTKMCDAGQEQSFAQEYAAAFTTAQASYFEADKIDAITDDIAAIECKRECVLGIDYGMSHSMTALSVARNDAKGIKVIWLKKFPPNYDPNNLLSFIERLKEDFNIVQLVVDDCPQGFTINNKLQDKGYHVTLFNFKRDKIKYYGMFRRRMYKGDLWIPKHTDLILEMKSLEQEETQTGNLKIHKPPGGYDDLIDSVIMACSPFLDDTEMPVELLLV